MIEVKDEILSGEARYRIRDDNGNIIFDNLTIEQITPVVQEGTPINKALFDNILSYFKKIGCVVGSYTGDSTKSRAIDLGFKPTAVFVMQRNILDESTNDYTGRYMGLATTNSSYICNTTNILTINETGFTLSDKTTGSQGYLLNVSNKVYNYIAFKEGVL